MMTSSFLNLYSRPKPQMEPPTGYNPGQQRETMKPPQYPPPPSSSPSGKLSVEYNLLIVKTFTLMSLSSRVVKKRLLGTSHYLYPGLGLKRNYFELKNYIYPTINNRKFSNTPPFTSLKNNYPPLLILLLFNLFLVAR